MKKIMNNPGSFVEETMEGIVMAYSDKVQFLNGDCRVLVSAYPKKKGKVGIVTGGGSGHLPLFLGYVGSGMVDACAVGNVFASPSYTKMAAAIRFADQGAGVLCLYGNYGGDKMNFEQAIEDCEFDDIECLSVLGCDDVASSPKETAEKRRGVAGIVYAYKCAGAAADQMRSLEEVAAVAQKTIDNTRTMGVALTPCIVPEVGSPTFAIGEDELEIGMGIHGEKGISVEKMMTADEIADIVMSRLLADMPLAAGDEVSVMINGLGGTPTEEQFIVFRRVAQILQEKGVSIFMPHIGEFATSMEMAGLSVTLLKLDAELKELLQAPANTPFIPMQINEGFAMTMESLKNAIGVIAEKIDENKEYLIQLDQQNGDGDLGISMSSGIHAVQDYLASNGETDLGKTLNRCGDFFNEAAPSSLGTIIAFFFKGMAKSLKGKENCSVLELAEGMQAGLDNVMQKAKSKPGEKTILDSLTPGVAALREYAGEPDAFTRAARAAREGSEKTRRMKAVWGRAAYYGENSVGILDGGSVVGALVFEALDEMKRNEEEE